MRTYKTQNKPSSINILAIGTQKDKGYEYRIGKVPGEQMAFLRRHDGSLNTHLAKECFGASKIFTDNEEAEKAAMKLFEEEFQKVKGSYMQDRIMSEHTEANAEADAAKEVASPKILHFNHPWPA